MSLFAETYDLIYGDKDYARDIEIFRTLYGLFPGPAPLDQASLLEIGAGTGNHTQRLAALVARLTATERDKAFLRVCGKKIAEANLPHVDVRADWPENAAPSYDAAAAFFHVLNYIADEAEMKDFIRHLGARLRSGGLFVFDMWHAEAVALDPPREETRHKQVAGHAVRQRIKPTYDAGRAQVCLDYDFSIQAPPGEKTDFQERIELKLWKKDQLENLFAASGFSCAGFWDYTGFPSPVSSKSWRLWGAFKRN